jgi:hypothetical protein
LGVSAEDVNTIATVLDSVFNYRCTPPLTADSGVPDFMVGTDPSICQATDCPVKDESDCEEDEMTSTKDPSPAPAGFPTFMPEEDASGGSHLAQYSNLICTLICAIIVTVFA